MVYGNDDSSTSPTTSPALQNSQSPCSTLMLWANQLKEPNKIDAGMMPPPSTTLPLNIRRSSLTGLLTCGSSDQTSPPILKSEIMDESSQNSIISNGADTLNHDSMDTFHNDNSMDGSNSLPEQLNLMNQIMQKNHAALSNPFATSTLNASSLMNVVDLRVKQEDDIAAQIQDMVVPSLDNNTKLMSAINPNESNYMSSLKNNDVPMFAAPSNNGTSQMLDNSLSAISHIVVPPPLIADQQTIEQQQSVFVPQTIMTEAGTATTLNHILSFPNAPAPILATSPNTSPLSADVMLNSQPVAAMNTSPTILSVETGNAPSLADIQTDSDIIMNPTISPTMMCSNGTADATNLIVSNAVTIGDTPMLTNAQQPPSDSISVMTNLMQPMTIKQTDAAVKNMILNAAAEILSSEPNSITQEITSNALMSLNRTPMITDTSPQQSQSPVANTPSITNILTHSDSTSSVVVLAGNNQLIQVSDIIFTKTYFKLIEF